MRNNNDYRLTQYDNIDLKITNQKDSLMKEIRLVHKRTRNIYSIVNDKKKKYKNKFFEIYNNRCCYCGVSNRVIARSSFEIDHVIPKSSFCGENEIMAHGIDNLVLACKNCNRLKDDYKADEENYQLLHPDNNKLSDIFYRDDEYYIRIQKNFQDNKDVVDVHTKLELDSQLRRLDYLLMELKGFCCEYPGDKYVHLIKRIIEKIEQYRRDVY